MEEYYVQNQGANSPNLQEDISIGKWLLILIGMAIPIVNIILLIILAVSNPNKSLKNYAIAGLIFIVAGIVLWAIVGSVIVGLFMSMTPLGY